MDPGQGARPYSYGTFDFLHAPEGWSLENYSEVGTEGVYRAHVRREGCDRLAAHWLRKIAFPEVLSLLTKNARGKPSRSLYTSWCSHPLYEYVVHVGTRLNYVHARTVCTRLFLLPPPAKSLGTRLAQKGLFSFRTCGVHGFLLRAFACQVLDDASGKYRNLIRCLKVRLSSQHNQESAQ